ncbi:MAG: DUF1345 domain-containing protein [Actinomycetota bacterium]|nr:DUF1345 domain-containing protein [Actinomycetota bacterium]
MSTVPTSDPRVGPRSFVRLAVSGVVGLAAGLAVGWSVDLSYGLLAGYLGAAGTYLTWTWVLIARMDQRVTAAHAQRDDTGRTLTELVVIVSAVASLGAVALLLASSSSGSRTVQALLSVLSVGVSWLSVHTVYTLRYGRLYYDGDARGIDFNETEPPTYLDFAYFAFNIGMSFQVSDTNISRKVIRATALRHALLAYLLGAVVVAATINLVSGLAK